MTLRLKTSFLVKFRFKDDFSQGDHLEVDTRDRIPKISGSLKEFEVLKKPKIFLF